MEVKTITQGRDGCKVSGAYKLIFPIRKDYYHIRNDGTETAYASVFSDSTDTAEDGVYDIPSGGTLCIRSHGSDTLYVSGEVTVMGTASAVCPFKIGLRGGDGYADVTATGNPVQLDGLQGGVPFSEIAVSGKNLIGISQAKGLTGDNTNGFLVFDNPASRSIIQKLQPNTTYHIKKYDSGNRFRIVMFDDEPTNTADVNAQQLIYNADGSISDYTLSTGDNHLWMTLATHYATSGEATEPIVQLEYGDTATEYEPPITGRELTVNVNGTDYTITPDSNPYIVPNDIRQQDGHNVVSVSGGVLSVTGCKSNMAVKRIWDKLDELATAIIVSNGENE